MKLIAVNDFGPTGFKWITTKRITWEDSNGVVRFWETAERTTRTGEVDGVAILPKVLRAGQAPHIVVISQYRPPLDNHCLELPAGLVDVGEDPAHAALRELKEETGYSGRVVAVLPPCGSDPGMSGSNLQIVEVEVDGDAPENQAVQQQLDDGEFICAELVPIHGLLQYLLDAMQQKGWDVDARLMSYATGLQHAEGLGSGSPLPGIPECSGAADAAADGLTAFGSMLSNDSDLSRTMEGAISAAAAAVPAGPSSCAVCGRQAAGATAAKAVEAAGAGEAPPEPPTEQQQHEVQRKLAKNGTDDGHLPGNLGSSGGGEEHMLQRLLRGACTAQFAAGVAVGVAAAAALWLRK